MSIFDKDHLPNITNMSNIRRIYIESYSKHYWYDIVLTIKLPYVDRISCSRFVIYRRLIRNTCYVVTLYVSYIVELCHLLVQLYHTVIIQAYHFILKVSMGIFVYKKLTAMTKCISFLIDIINHTSDNSLLLKNVCFVIPLCLAVFRLLAYSWIIHSHRRQFIQELHKTWRIH